MLRQRPQEIGKCCAGIDAGAGRRTCLEEILLTLQANHVIFLTGAKRPRTHCSPVNTVCLLDTDCLSGAMGRDGGRIDTRGSLLPSSSTFAEIWQIREVASPDASVQGRGGAIRIKSAKFDLLLMGLYPPPLGDWATDRIYDWADKMVHAAPSRCCVVVGGDLNAHVGYVRHPEREALDLEREVMEGCGEYHQVEANYNCERLAKFCRDPHMAMVNTHYPRGGPTYWNALGGREVASKLVKHCFVVRREGRRLPAHPPPDDHATIGH